MSDPWRHRSEMMKCKTCMWFAGKATPSMKDGDFFKIGRCRKNAPTMTGYPVVFTDDWCGQHKLDECAL